MHTLHTILKGKNLLIKTRVATKHKSKAELELEEVQIETLLYPKEITKESHYPHNPKTVFLYKSDPS